MLGQRIEQRHQSGPLVVAGGFAQDPLVGEGDGSDGIQAAGGEAMAVVCDVTQTDEVQAAVAQTLNEFGKIDVLVANAGIGARSPAEEMSDEQWERVMDINLRGTFLVSRAVVPGMLERGAGSIVNVVEFRCSSDPVGSGVT